MIRYQITTGAHIHPGVDFVQIRPGEARAVREAVKRHPRVLVNDRADIALAFGAAGVHLRSNSIAPKRLRAIVPQGFIITVACHSLEDVLEAAGADYVLLSPVFHPISKLATNPPLGLGYLREVCAHSSVRVLALGGIDEENAALCMEAGAAGIAGISIFGG